MRVIISRARRVRECVMPWARSRFSVLTGACAADDFYPHPRVRLITSLSHQVHCGVPFCRSQYLPHGLGPSAHHIRKFIPP